eukprot:m51a1_g972 hypothetical protein (529) ;mRNA; r:388435-390201
MSRPSVVVVACIALVAAAPLAGASVTGICDPMWDEGWSPFDDFAYPVRPAQASTNFWAYFHVVGSLRSAPECTATLSFADGTTRRAQATAESYTVVAATRWGLNVVADLADRFAVGGNATLAVACADPANSSSRAEATWRFVLGTCADSGPAECVGSSATNGACALCGGRCVPMPADLRAANCSVCGDGVVASGEQCEQSLSPYCTRLCRCPRWTVPTGNGSCTALPGLGAITVQTQAPLGYDRARRVAAAVASGCLSGLRELLEINASDVLVLQDDVRPLVIFWAYARPGAPRNASTPHQLLWTVRSACVNDSVVAAEGLQATWAVRRRLSGCGDGVVSGDEACDSSDYCDLVLCECTYGSIPTGDGRCAAEPCWVGFTFDGHSVGDDVAQRVAAQMGARCFDYGEVALANATASRSEGTIRAAVVPAAGLLPGARPPNRAVRGALWFRESCLAAVLRDNGLVYQRSTGPYLSADGIPGFGPWVEPLPPASSSARRPAAASSTRSGAQGGAALAPLALLLAAVARAL